MSQQLNVRQRELEQQQKAMLQLAINYVTNAGNDYSFPQSKEFFLADFRLSFHASDYASKRYFRDFETLEVFVSVNEKTFTLTAEKRIQTYMSRRFGVTFPAPKPLEVAHKSGKRT